MIEKIKVKFLTLQNRFHLWRLNLRVGQVDPLIDAPTIAFFNASTRIYGLSLNAAFALLSSWGLRLSGMRVAHFVCNSGVTHCMQGTKWRTPEHPMPCVACVAQSKRIYRGSDATWFEYDEDTALSEQLLDLSLVNLSGFEYGGIPLGQLTLPGLRWVMRKHNLDDDVSTRYLFRQFILSAFNLSRKFNAFLDKEQPETVVVFNGLTYPEATARWVAKQRGIRVITFETSLQVFSGYFTDKHATHRAVEIDENFALNDAQNKKLDTYLEKRFQGEFSMAGVEFWPEMQALDAGFLKHTEDFKQIVPIFPNVIFDTSQVHANVVYEHMFAWLDDVLGIIKAHPETLFVIRAHPDELRPGKASRESVRDWIQDQNVLSLENVTYIDATEYISSYALIQRAKFMMIYNSSIGLEGTLLNTPVLCAAESRYTAYPTVFFPQTPTAYRQQAEEFLATEKVTVPDFQIKHARRFLYAELYHASLLFDDFLKPHSTKGFTVLKSFSVKNLLPENAPTIQILQDGLLKFTKFHRKDDA